MTNSEKISAYIAPIVDIGELPVIIEDNAFNLVVNSSIKDVSSIYVKTIKGTYKESTEKAFSIALSLEANLFGEKDAAGKLKVLQTESNGVDVAISIELFIVDHKPESMRLVLDVENVPLTKGLQQLGTLIGLGDQFEIPDFFPIIEASLNDFEINLSFAKKIQAVRGAVQLTFKDSTNTNKGWSPLPSTTDIGVDLSDIIRLENIGMSFEWHHIFGTSWQVDGRGSLTDYYLECAYSHPQQRIYTHLFPSSSDGTAIKDFLNKTLKLPNALSQPLASVLSGVELTVDANFKSKDILFKINNYSDAEWEIVDNFSVAKMDFRIYWLNGAFGVAELYLDLSLPIGPSIDGGGREDVLIELEGTFDKTEENSAWFFEAEVDDPIAVGDLITGIAEKFGADADEVPEPIRDLLLDDLYLSFEHQGSETTFKFSSDLIFPIADKELKLHLNISLSKSQNKWKVQLETSINFSGYTFAIEFDNSEGNLVLATFTNKNAAFNLAALLEEIAPGEIDAIIPDDLELDINNAFIGFYSPSKPKETIPANQVKEKAVVVFGLEIDLSADINLGEVPAIGALLKEVTIELEALRLVGLTADMKPSTLTILDHKLQEKGIRGLSAGQSSQKGSSSSDKEAAFYKGVYLSTSLKLLEPIGTIPLYHGFTSKEEAKNQEKETKDEGKTKQNASSLSAKGSQKGSKNRALQPVGQQLGPFFIEHIGLSMSDGKFGLKFTGGLVIGPIAAQVINFSIRSSLSKFSPEFDIEGLGIGYDKPPVMIAGLLMKYEETVPETPSKDTPIVKETIGVRGGLSIGLKQVSITALGAYAHVKEYDSRGTLSDSFHSMFLFGFLGAPLGGPPFLFVTGLALGAGFNMGLNIPPPAELTVFPLTAAALKPPGQALSVDDLKDIMLSLDKYMPIKKGNFWFAIGIKFESFKFLSGFLMLTLEFGDELEIGIIGILDAMMPVGVANPVIRISIGIVIRIIPTQGIVEARGAFLPTTFIFHEDVKISGEMAFLAIMKDQNSGEWEGGKAGEFIFTLGGYGPLYTPKKYYPTVAPLQLDWTISSDLYVRAKAYFALTPEAIMMGGNLEIHCDFEGGPVWVKIDVRLGADFILYWKPIKYIGQIYAELHIKGGIHVDLWLFSVDYSLEMDASAKLKVWGPEFSGEAHVKLHFIISFSVSVDFGGADSEVKAIEWKDFKESLLPESDKILNISITEGIIQESRERVIPTLNRFEAGLRFETQIPIAQKTDELGIKPVGIKSDNFASPMTYSIQSYVEDDGVYVDQNSSFKIEKIFKNVPTALWQSATETGKIPTSNGVELIQNTLCGYELKAIKPELVGFEELDAATVDDILKGPIKVLETSNMYAYSKINEEAIPIDLVQLFVPVEQ